MLLITHLRGLQVGCCCRNRQIRLFLRGINGEHRSAERHGDSVRRVAPLFVESATVAVAIALITLAGYADAYCRWRPAMVA